MDNIKFETNGWVFFLKPFLTFGQKRQIKKLIADAMKLNAETSEADTSISGSVVFEAQDAVLRMMIVSATKPDGNVLQGFEAYKAVQDFHGEDEKIGAALYDKIDDITGKSYIGDTVEEKKS